MPAIKGTYVSQEVNKAVGHGSRVSLVAWVVEALPILGPARPCKTGFHSPIIDCVRTFIEIPIMLTCQSGILLLLGERPPKAG